MKNQNDTAGPDRKGADPEGAATEVPASATGMFERPVKPPAQPEFEDPNAAFRAAALGEVSVSREPAGPNVHRAPMQAANPAGDPSLYAGEKPGPGEFTRVFQAVTPPATTSSARARPLDVSTASPASSQMPPEPSLSTEEKAGEFTRIFMPLPKEPDPGPPSAMPVVQESLRAAGNLQAAGIPQASETGEFTRLMRAAELMAKPPRAGGAPPAVPTVPASTPVRGISTPGSNDAVSGTAGVTELFVAPPHPPAAPPDSSPWAGKATPPGRQAATPTGAGWASGEASNASQEGGLPRRESAQEPSAGEFTQLFRALDRDRESSTPTPSTEVPLPAPSPLAGKLSDAAAGEFTQLMQSISHERPGGSRTGIPAQPQADVSVPGRSAGMWPEPMPAQSAGALEESASFTRIISSSAVREEAARGTRPAAEPSPAKGVAPAPVGAPMPAMPRPLETPAIPRAAAFGQPSAPAAPSPPVLPSPAPLSTPQSKLQAYLPLLLILNAFVLAVLIVLVVFALRRH